MKKYSKTHEYVEIRNDVAYIGISDHAQDALGYITFVELPKIGSTLKQSQDCGVVESVKAASDIYAPISGEVSSINENLETTPELINQSAENDGWLFTLKSYNQEDFENLMNEDEYQKFLDNDL